MPTDYFATQFNAQQLLFEAFFNITCIFGINILVYGIFACPSSNAIPPLPKTGFHSLVLLIDF